VKKYNILNHLSTTLNTINTFPVGTKIAKKTAIFPTGLDLKFISHKGGVLALYGNMDPPVEKIAEKAACRF